MIKFLVDLIDNILKKTGKFGFVMTLFFTAVFFVVVSAQYIGTGISKKIVSSQKVKVVILTNSKNSKNYKKIVSEIADIKDLQSKNVVVKIEKIENDTDFYKKGNFDIIITENSQDIQQLQKNNMLGVLNKTTFQDRTLKFVEFSDFIEYARALTYLDNEIYISVGNSSDETTKARSQQILYIINSTIIKKENLDPYYRLVHQEQKGLDKK